MTNEVNTVLNASTITEARELAQAEWNRANTAWEMAFQKFGPYSPKTLLRGERQEAAAKLIQGLYPNR